MEWYRGKKVFITGGSSGIGLAAAKLLARAGASVWLSARGRERLDAALEEVRAAAVGGGQRFGATALDISDREAVRAAAAEVLEGLGGLDVLVNNAGIAHPSTVLETSDEVFEDMMRVNYLGMVWVTKAFLPHLQAQRSGHIVNVSSVLGFMGIYGYTAYAASKHAIVGFSDCLRQELLDYGVGLSVLYPPDTDTPQLEQENRIKPPETAAISEGGGLLTAEQVAMAMLRGAARGKYQIVPGAEGRFAHFMNRHAPGVVRFVIDRDLKKYRKEHGGPTARPEPQRAKS